ncbi:Uncharacterised protein [uncultured archaeon]|nr:Uncharacterised protein [uncultured archaeon]
MGKRSVLKALVMGAVPLVNAYLFYCWCNEAKVKWRLEGVNSTFYAVLFAIPVIGAYPAYRFLSLAEANLGGEGRKAYALPPVFLALIFAIPLVSCLEWIYLVYRTQLLFNENGVATLA